MSHELVPPTQTGYDYLSKLKIDITNGVVYGLKGEPVGYSDPSGYVKINTPDGTLKRYHIIWWKAKGEWPTQMIDHDDRDKANDRIENLIPSTTRMNALNTHRSDREMSPGVYKSAAHNQSKPFLGRIWLSGRQHHLGTFATEEEAAAAVRTAHVNLAQYGEDFFKKPEEVKKLLPQGVRLHLANKSRPYKTKIWIKGKEVFLGYFKTAEEASEAFQKAKAVRDGNS